METTMLKDRLIPQELDD